MGHVGRIYLLNMLSPDTQASCTISDGVPNKIEVHFNSTLKISSKAIKFLEEYNWKSSVCWKTLKDNIFVY